MSAAFASVGFGRGNPEDAGLNPAILEEHRRRIHDHRKNGVFPGYAEGIVVNGKVVYLDLCGCTDKEGTTRMSEKTLFRGYSMMKPITIVALMTLVEEKRLRLDDPVSKYLPRFKDLKVRKASGNGVEALKKPITLRHLVMHTSGIGYGPGVPDSSVKIVARSVGEKTYRELTFQLDNGEIDTLEKLCDALCDLPLLAQPGKTYEYGFGVDVVGRVMELVTGQSLHQIIQERVLTPCGMRDTCRDVNKSAAKQVCGYYRLMRTVGGPGRWLERLDGAKPELSAYVRGSDKHYGKQGIPTAGGVWGSHRTGLLFSVRDVLLFCQMILNDGVSVSGRRVLQAATVKSLSQNWLLDKRAADKPNPPGWGTDDVGWSALGNVQLTGPQKGALFMGGMSYFYMDPSRKLAAAIMTETYWQVNPIGWKERTDTLEQVLERAVESGAKAHDKELKALKAKPKMKAKAKAKAKSSTAQRPAKRKAETLVAADAPRARKTRRRD